MSSLNVKRLGPLETGGEFRVQLDCVKYKNKIKKKKPTENS